MNLRHAALTLALLSALPSLAIAARGFEVRDLAKLDRYSAPTLSPDGRKLVFAKRVVDFAANKSSTSLWIEDLFARDAAPPVRLTPDGWNVNSPSFSNDGTTVYFLSAKSGSMQLYAIPTAGGEPKQLTDFSTDVGSYKLSPDGTQLAFSTEAFVECKADFSCNLKKLKEREDSKNTGLVFDRMFIRHWDTWNDGRLNRVFVAPLGDGKAQLKSATLVGGDVLGDVPSKPFGDDSEYGWAPDGKSLVLSARNADRQEPWSTNFDLFQVNADGTGAAKNLTAANKAWDTGPVFSSDGRTLVLPRDEAPRFRGRSLRADGDGPRQRQDARDRGEVGCVGRRHHLVRRRHDHLHDGAGTRPASAVLGVDRGRQRVAGGRRRLRCPRSTSPGRRWRIRRTRSSPATSSSPARSAAKPGLRPRARSRPARARCSRTSRSATTSSSTSSAGTTRPCTVTWSSRGITKPARSTRSHS